MPRGAPTAPTAVLAALGARRWCRGAGAAPALSRTPESEGVGRGCSAGALGKERAIAVRFQLLALLPSSVRFAPQ